MPNVDFDGIFREFRGVTVGVIGDVMLDTYLWGRVDRISPEAPVPVVELLRKDHRIGGAGNVALNLAALGARVSVLSVIGTDEDGSRLRQMLDAQDIGTAHLVESRSRITTNKTRIISRNQHMLRLDNEVTADLDSQEESSLLAAVQAFIDKESPRIIVLEDYNKGVLTATLLAAVIDLCRRKGIITTADPKRRNFFAFKGVDIFKPNLKEVKEGLNIIDGRADHVMMEEIHQRLKEQLQHRISFVTLSEKGVFFADEDRSMMIPSHVRNIADVSGAGDTVIAVASLTFAITGDMRLAAEMANIAGGLVCEEVGTVAIDGEKLLRECKLLLG
jgi:rfaE bifunctional protein kinase chain/domain